MSDSAVTNGKKVIMRPFIATLVIIGSFGLFAIVVFGFCKPEWEKVVFLIVGALIANLTTVVSWYFGSSEDSSKKTDMMMMK